MRLIEHLMRGGTYGHFWTKQTKKSLWWPIDTVAPIPQDAADTYFGVHPSKVQKGSNKRTKVEDIEAVNCLYADLDAKDYVDKKGVAEHIKTLTPIPSVIVDSGGGYHCYWLLREPYLINGSDKRNTASNLQKKWVSYVGGDPAAQDLARVLRLPGTYNHKYDQPQLVRVVFANMERLYNPQELEAYLPVTEVEVEIPKSARPNKLSLQEIVDLAQHTPGGPKFRKLWQGFNEGYASNSEGDLALCCILAFWTGGDYKKIDQLFMASPRMRDKWNREDYKHSTILKALGQVTDYYTDPGGATTAGANDEGNAQCVYAANKKKFAYCEALGWVHFTGTHWARETAESLLDRATIKTLRERRAEAARTENLEEKTREAIIKAAKPSATNVRNCKTLLKSLMIVPVSSFDASQDELNCPNGILNLKTGQLSPPDISKRFSYCIGVPYNPDADSSFWVSWLLEATGGHQDVLDFLQLAVGYSITGHVREEMMFYIYGPARAGKGTFTETLLAMLGGRPLATEVGMEMFLSKRAISDQGFDLASLKAARMVFASESKESHWLDASKIKRWSGGNWITCAHKYQSPFTYRPQFKIWLISNFPIQMDADDVAGWSRVQVIQFPNSFLGREDKTLKARMRDPEILQGVLAWVVEGAIKWYALPKEGLRAPKLIEVETRAARERLDWVSEWVSEGVLDTEVDDVIPGPAYYQRYKDWCDERGVSAKGMRALNASLRRMGYTVGKLVTQGGKTQRCWVGARLVGESFRESLGRMADDTT